MGKVVEIHLGEYRGSHFFDLHDVDCQQGEEVILEVDRGMEFGKVLSNPQAVCTGKTEAVEGKVIRKVTEGDRNQITNNRLKAQEAISQCFRKVIDRKLDMQIVKAEYAFDCSKVIFYFLADGRVDFRNLVKDLAKIFHVRIELKQIGVRDKAKIVGGYGVCGRELCCSSFLKGFHPLSIKMAKTQNLPLNPSRISGVCGRIKCCMAYEFMVYKELAKNLPFVGDKVATAEGKGKVIDVNILKKLVMVDMGEGKIVKVAYDGKEE
ncbi:MAG: stage 0 sporulation protein [Candidatus Omnitrophica bacterium]|nr:stage 0 sporulation protein [Candidatus Omnitrophota bacterium]